MTRELPARIHRYRILHELGIGSMGRVYLAEDPNIGRRLALKVLSPERLSTPEKQAEVHQRFLYEARAAGSLDHPGIVTVFDADSDPLSGDPYLAMEYVDGFSLRDLLERQGPPSIPRTLQILSQVARALGFAHQHGVIHRDIKPANLLIRKHDGVAKVVDFGIAKLVSPALTQPGRLLGTPFYMAPEHLRSEPLDGRADLFSLGVVLYECLTGRLPFQAEHIAGVHQKILQDEAPPLGPGFPRALESVVQRALAKDPDARFSDGASLAEALEGIGAELPTTGMPRGGPAGLANRGTTELPAPDPEFLATQPSKAPGPPAESSPAATASLAATPVPADSAARETHLPPPPPVPLAANPGTAATPGLATSSGSATTPAAATTSAGVPSGATPEASSLVLRWGLLVLGLVMAFVVALWAARSFQDSAPEPIDTRRPLRVTLAKDAPRGSARHNLQLPATAPDPHASTSTGVGSPTAGSAAPSATSEEGTSGAATATTTAAATDSATGPVPATLLLELRPRLSKARVVVLPLGDDPTVALEPLFDEELQAQGALRWRKMTLPPLELPADVRQVQVRVINVEKGVDAEGRLVLDTQGDGEMARLLVRPQRRGAEQTLEERQDPDDDG